MSAATKAKISAANKGRGRPQSPESRARIRAALLGRIPSEATLEKRRQAMRGRKLSPEHRAKMSAANKGRWIGRPIPPEQRAKISASNLGKKRLAETRARIAAAKRGVPTAPRTAVCKAKISAANRGAGNGQARLTVAAVLEIRRRYAAGGVTYAVLGREFGVTPAAAGEVVRRTNWGWVEEQDDGLAS